MDEETEIVNKENVAVSETQRDNVPNEEASDNSETVASGTETNVPGSAKPQPFTKVDFLGGGNFQCGDFPNKETENIKTRTRPTMPIIVIEEPEAERKSQSHVKDCYISRTDNSVAKEIPGDFNAGDQLSYKEAGDRNSQNNFVIDPTDEINVVEDNAVSDCQTKFTVSEKSHGVETGLALKGISPEIQEVKNDHVKNGEQITSDDEVHSAGDAIVEVNDTVDCSEDLKKDEVEEKEMKLQKEVPEELGGTQEVEENEHGSEVEDEKQTDEALNGDSQKNRSRTYPYKVFVSGLPLSARLEDITRFFSQFGEVFKTFNEGRHKANVIFSDAESVKKAVFYPDPYFDDHKLMIKSVNEVTSVINGIPQSMLLRDAEKAIKKCMEEADVPVCRVSIPQSDSNDLNERRLLQGHAFVVFCDQQTLQKAEEKQKQEPFIVADAPVVLFPSINQFYKQFCVRVFALPSEQPRSIVYHSVRSTLSECGDIISQVCVYVPSSSSYAVYVLFTKEEAVKSALEMTDMKIFDQFVEVQEFYPFETGQGFRHLWLKVLNLPPRVTVTEMKHHFGHDKGILYIELDMDFGSCFVHVDSEHAIQRCLRMHQTYLRGKCITVMIADDHPARNNYFRGGRQNNRNRSNYNRNMKKHMGGGGKGSGSYNGMTFTSGQNTGNQERRGYDWKERKFSKLRNSPSEGPQQSQNSPKANGGEANVENVAS